MTGIARIPGMANLCRTIFVACGLVLAAPQAAYAQPVVQVPAPVTAGPIPATALTYVDLVELGMAADLVLRSQVSRQTAVGAERAPGLQPGKVRLYVQAATQALLAGSGSAANAYAFLVDLPLTDRGRRPKLKNEVVLLFGRRVEGRPGELQMVGPAAIQPADPLLEQRVRQVLIQLVQGERPPVISGVREVMSVPGNLAGESETQLFLETRGGAPASVTVLRRPGMAPTWGVSWTELVDQAALPPAPDTLQWYALACFLPPELPAAAFIQSDPAARARARADYALVREDLGTCARSSG